ncbi:ferredoxin [Streptomyces fulvoviolaceus]|uniref:ferredoxin n=1 Tax=Streptomyces fulvoviolaceus TaxID=285535 RepID=UPI0004CA0849|nr:ferredoxin [Streptomyces fulvoviolaceus]
MFVNVDLARCISSGQCALALPEVFDQHADDGTVVLLDGAPPAALDDELRAAADVCPARAIRLAEPRGETER